MIYESWHFEIAFNFLAQLHLVDFDVQFHTSHATLKDFAYDIVLALIVFIKLPYFSSYDHALCEMNPTCKNDYDSHNMFEGKCTNVSCSIFLIHYAWAWCSSHSNSIFSFDWLLFFHYMGIIQMQTFMKLWSCHLSPSRQIDIWICPLTFEICVWSKC
jgi:hypothetical protein